MDAEVRLQCEFCGKPLLNRSRGRRRRFCSDACRQSHRKVAATPENGLRYRTGRVKPKSASQGVDVTPEFRPENPSLRTDLPLKCEKVNEVTFKITNGELTNVRASHGQWGGYRTTKALAWILKLGPDAWVARCGDRICNPKSFNEAKAQALATARGENGDYVVQDPIRELNELQARILANDEDRSE